MGPNLWELKRECRTGLTLGAEFPCTWKGCFAIRETKRGREPETKTEKPKSFLEGSL